MSNYTILIVDDEPINITLLKDLLKDEPYFIKSVINGEQAIEAVKEYKPDLILLDILMPGMDGYAVCRAIRSDPQYQLIKIIMISAMAMLQERLEGYEAGADDYIVKPFRGEELLAKIQIMLRLKESEKENMDYQRRLEAIFRSVKDGIITVDNSMRIIEANDATEKICDMPYKQMIHKPFNEVFRYCSNACQQVLSETLTTHNVVKDHRIECKPNHQPNQVVVLSCSPLIDHSNNMSGAVMVIRDTTQINNLEKELIGRSRYHNIIGKSESMQKVYRLLENLSDTNTTVLITGESGTGKELVAAALHYGSARAKKPFIKVNCSALSENILESELFGHVKGAFTGAIRSRIGRFQAANEGTLFLDEIGDISPLIQLKLLRVLQEKEFERVGDTATYKVDVRVIAATNQNLKEKVRMGEFREDLYYRLKVVEIHLPALKERREDIPMLFNTFCTLFNKEFNKEIDGLSEDALNIFMNYPWPGNVRELQHAIEHAFVLCNTKTITIEHLPSEISHASPQQQQVIIKKKFSHPDDEAQHILDALKKTGWNIAKSARLLGLSRPTIYKKIKMYELDKPAY